MNSIRVCININNDVIWKLTLLEYTWNVSKRQKICSIYHQDYIRKGIPPNLNTKRTRCLFMKSHEPIIGQRNQNEYTVRAVLLLRHPFDASFANYKRYVCNKKLVFVQSLETVSIISAMPASSRQDTTSYKLVLAVSFKR